MFPRQLFPALAAALVVALSAVPAHAQTPTASGLEIKIDAPVADATINNGTEVDIGGWAVDPAGPGTGIDEVRVFLDGEMDRGGSFLGRATYPKPRPDVAAAKGNPAFANSGYDYVWRPRTLSPGPHRIYVYAHSTANGWSWQSLNVNGPSNMGAQIGGPGMYGMYGPTTPYGGNYLTNSQYGLAGTGAYPYGQPPCAGPSSYLDPRCPPPPPPPPPPPLIPPVAPVAPTSALPAPTAVTAAAVTGTTVTLTWMPVPGAASYRVIASVGTTGLFFPATITNLSATGAVVRGLSPVTQYMLQVVAVDVSGNQGVASAPISVTTTPGP